MTIESAPLCTTSVAFVANEAIQPARHGGRVRMAGLVHGLRAVTNVHVIELGSEQGEHRLLGDDDLVRGGRHSSLRTLGYFASRRPRLGAAAVRGAEQNLAARIASLPVVAVIASQSYLAPFVQTELPLVIDFQNIEINRMFSFAKSARGAHRASALLEAAKALFWERNVATRAALCVTCTPSDAELLSSWGAEAVLVPHASDAVPLPPSPPGGNVLLVASAGYRPNDRGVEWFLGRVWPHVRLRCPGARLRIVGRGMDRRVPSASDLGIEVLGEVENLSTVFTEAAVVVAPVQDGGGAQLKVVDALAHGRLLVATSYSAQSAPPSARDSVWVADDPTQFATLVIEALRNHEARHAAEEALRRPGVLPTWRENVKPLVDWLDRL